MKIKKILEAQWEKESAHPLFQSPARINIIGEHVDYLGGLVLPAAMHFSTDLAIRPNHSDTIRLFSVHFQEKLEVNTLQRQSEKKWANYILGVVDQLNKSGKKTGGFDLVVDGNIPQGAGLSSSASLEVGTAFALSEIFHLSISRPDLAVLGQKAENEFVGTRCGIMDQFIIAVGKKEKAILLNTDTLEFDYHTVHLENAEFYLINSHVKHSLETSGYNDRRRDCENALEKIQKKDPGIKTLYSLPSEKNLQSYNLTNQEEMRVTHVVGERERTNSILKAFETSDLSQAGKILFETHASLSKNYEVSCPETDFLVEELMKAGVLGARMIGGGFGGCILVLDRIGNFDSIRETVGRKYFEKFSIQSEFFPFQISDGVKEIGQSEDK